jgi:hypothetical protein
VFDGNRVQIQLGFHDQVKTAILPDHDCEIGALGATVRPRNIENPLSVFEKRIHLILLSARPAAF